MLLSNNNKFISGYKLTLCLLLQLFHHPAGDRHPQWPSPCKSQPPPRSLWWCWCANVFLNTWIIDFHRRMSRLRSLPGVLLSLNWSPVRLTTPARVLLTMWRCVHTSDLPVTNQHPPSSCFYSLIVVSFTSSNVLKEHKLNILSCVSIADPTMPL